DLIHVHSFPTLRSSYLYSRFFLTSSFITLMLWQIVDTLLLSAGLRPQLVAVPSKLVEQIKTLPEANVTVLGHPQLETPATSEMRSEEHTSELQSRENLV